MDNSIRLSGYVIATLGFLLAVGGLTIKLMGGQIDSGLVAISVGAITASVSTAFFRIARQVSDFKIRIEELESRLKVDKQE